MNNFLSGVIFCCQKGSFLAETAVQSSRLSVLGYADICCITISKFSCREDLC